MKCTKFISICVLSVVLLLSSVCCLVCSAEDNSRTYIYSSAHYGDQLHTYGSSGSSRVLNARQSNTLSREWDLSSITDNYLSMDFNCIAVHIPVIAGEYLIWDDLEFTGWLGGYSTSQIYILYFYVQYRLPNGLADYDLLYTSSYVNEAGNGYHFPVSAGSYKFEHDCTFEGLNLTFAVYQKSARQFGYFSTTFKNQTFTLSGSTGADRPMYDPPDYTSIHNYEALENALLTNQQSGLNAASNLFNTFSLSSYVKGLGAWVEIFNHLTGGAVWLYSLISVSLALGCFAFVFGLFKDGVSASDRAERRQRRQRASHRHRGG